MKIGTRLNFGFGGIILVILTTFFISHFSLQRMNNTQQTLKSSSKFYNEIAEVDSMIEQLQRYIILYADAGMSSIFDKVTHLSVELTEKLAFINRAQANTAQQNKILLNMQQSIVLLTEQFVRAAEDRSERDLLLHGTSLALIDRLELAFAKLIGDEQLSEQLKYQLLASQMNVLSAQKSMLLYVTSPDSKRSKDSRKRLYQALQLLISVKPQLEQLGKQGIAQGMIADLRSYKSKSAQIFRLTRGYLFIFNGVIAGQASEFSRSSNELKNISLNQRELLFLEFNQRVNKFSDTLKISAALSVIMGLFFAWYTARGIVDPLHQITTTLSSLSKGLDVEQIPGLQYKNEIGAMAKSAQIFKEKNNQTEQLLIEAKQTAQVLLENRQELKLHQENLEEMVHQRTQQLEQSIVTLKETQTQLAKSERMATIGNMVQGVAHELNTPVGLALTAATHIYSDSNIMADKVKDGKLTKDSLTEYLDSTISLTDSMSTSLEKAAQLIKSFKLVSVNEHQEHLQQFNLKDHLNNLLASMRRSIDKKFHISNLIADDIVIDSYPGVFYQIYTNFMNNSILHGFDGLDQGEITISAVIDGENLILDYRDDGIGMDKQTQNNLYEAFFTTKRARGGTGLGMNIVQALVNDKLHGVIKLTSELGEGTQYTLTLPLKAQSSHAEVTSPETLSANVNS
ncbi:MAG: HAMP domain-containing histidine kinase [Gammaproteobacteria bacterium]|nr:HAMP domain-containing histidine kinase [Gammaproteobacteria bacterium]